MLLQSRLYQIVVLSLLLLIWLIASPFALASELDFVPDPQNPADYPSAYDQDGDGQLEAPTIAYTLNHLHEAATIAQRLAQQAQSLLHPLTTQPIENCPQFTQLIEFLALSPMFTGVPASDVGLADLYTSSVTDAVQLNGSLVDACATQGNTDQHHFDAAYAGLNTVSENMNNLIPEVARTQGVVVGTGTAASCTQDALSTALATGGQVTFNCGPNPVVIPISQRLSITKDTDIDGMNHITLDGQNQTGILMSEDNLTVGLHNITIQNGHTNEQGGGFQVGFWNTLEITNVRFENNVSTAQTASCDGGGALFIGGGSTAHIEESIFNGNQANNGGAINNLRTKLTILHTSFDGNTALHTDQINQYGDCGGGGAIYFDGTRKPEDGGPDPVVWNHVKFINNTSNNHGGAIFFGIRSGEQVQIHNATFEGNTVRKSATEEQSGTGGALWLGPGVGGQTGFSFVIDNSSFVNNHADFQGGAFWTRSAATLTNVTFAGNSAINPHVADRSNWRRGNGGAITAADQAQVVLNNATIVDNTAGFNGGGLNGENIAAMNTLIANNVGEWDTGLQQNCTHFVLDRGNNLQFLEGHATANHGHDSNCGDNVMVVNPNVGQVGFNGGSTKTVPLLAGSGAIDAGNNATCALAGQNGVARPTSLICDIGSFESVGVPSMGDMTAAEPATVTEVTASTPSSAFPQ